MGLLSTEGAKSGAAREGFLPGILGMEMIDVFCQKEPDSVPGMLGIYMYPIRMIRQFVINFMGWIKKTNRWLIKP